MEQKLKNLYAQAREEPNPIKERKLLNQADKVEQQLSLQGANPKKVPHDLLSEHIRSPCVGDDALANEYRSKIKNRATAIRAYCVGSCMGNIVDVRECVSFSCPLHPFRMGKDPFRGWDIPKVEEPVIEDDDLDIDEFEEGDDDE